MCHMHMSHCAHSEFGYGMGLLEYCHSTLPDSLYYANLTAIELRFFLSETAKFFSNQSINSVLAVDDNSDLI